MTALSEALNAAQSRAITALERAYLAGLVGDAELLQNLTDTGSTDVIEQAQLLACLNTLRDYGAQPPAEAKPNSAPAEWPGEWPSGKHKGSSLTILSELALREAVT